MEEAIRIEQTTQPFQGVTTTKFAMWLFLASEVMFFAGLISSYIAIRVGSQEWPVAAELLNVPLTGVNTFLLICSSVTMVRAFAAIEGGHQGGLWKNLIATALLGLVFVGIKAYEWNELAHEGIGPTTNLFGASYFTLTGFHALHVLAGVAVLLYLVAGALRGRYTRDEHGTIEIVGLYWHFVDIVWIFLFTIIYLI